MTYTYKELRRYSCIYFEGCPEIIEFVKYFPKITYINSRRIFHNYNNRQYIRRPYVPTIGTVDHFLYKRKHYYVSEQVTRYLPSFCKENKLKNKSFDDSLALFLLSKE